MDSRLVHYRGQSTSLRKNRKKPFCLFRKRYKTNSFITFTEKNKQLFLLSVAELGDKELMDNYILHNCSISLTELYERYSSKIFGTCFLLLKDLNDAQDATMEVFEKVMLKLPESRPKYFPGWIYAVSRNHCLETIRRKKISLDSAANSFWVEEVVEPDENFGGFSDTEDATDGQIAASLAKLSEAQQICIRLFYFQEKTYKEIARETGMTEKDVKSHLQNGKRNLKNLLSPWYKNIKLA